MSENLDLNTPVVGYYKRRLVRGGPWVAARIWQEGGERDEAGDLLSDERLLCEIDGQPRDALEQWPYLADSRIDHAEYLYLLADSQHAKAHRVDDPKATPTAPVDFAGMGHNRPDDPLAAADALLHEPKPAKVETVDQAHVATLWIKRAQAIFRKLGEAKREAEKPHREALAATSAPYKATIDRLEMDRLALLAELHAWRAANDMPKVATDYGATATTRATQSVEITDAEALPRWALEPAMLVIEEALIAGKTVPGARLRTDQTTVVR